MRAASAAAVAVACLAMTGCGRESIDGTYEITAVKIGPISMDTKDAAKGEDRTVVIRDGKVTMPKGLGEKDGPKGDLTFTLDGSKTPKQVDLRVTEGGKTENVLGIYKVEKDVLTVAIDGKSEGKTRPTDFAGETLLIVTLTKKK